MSHFQSVYKNRLEKLVAGYSKQQQEEEEEEEEEGEETILCIPIAILKLIERWYSGTIQPKLKMKSITYSEYSPMHFEIYFNEKTNKILQVQQYQLTATINNTQKDKTNMFKKVVTINTIYDDDYFISIWTLNMDDHKIFYSHFNFNHGNIANIKFDINIHALDENNNILCTLKKQIKVLYATETRYTYLYSDAHYKNKFTPSLNLKNFHLIDHHATTNTVNVNQFLTSMKKLLSKQHLNELILKRYFYFLYEIYNYNKFDAELIDHQNICCVMSDLNRFNPNHFIWKVTNILTIKLDFTDFAF